MAHLPSRTFRKCTGADHLTIERFPYILAAEGIEPFITRSWGNRNQNRHIGHNYNSSSGWCWLIKSIGKVAQVCVGFYKLISTSTIFQYSWSICSQVCVGFMYVIRSPPLLSRALNKSDWSIFCPIFLDQSSFWPICTLPQKLPMKLCNKLSFISGQDSATEWAELRGVLHGQQDLQLQPLLLVLPGQGQGRTSPAVALAARRARLAHDVWLVQGKAHPDLSFRN